MASKVLRKFVVPARRLSVRGRRFTACAFSLPVRHTSGWNNNWTRSHRMFVGGMVTMAVSSAWIAQSKHARCDEDFHFVSTLEDLRESQCPHALLDLFRTMYAAEGDSRLSKEFLQKFFERAGADSPMQVSDHIFEVMDHDHSGYLESHEIAALLTLLQTGSQVEKFKFLFHCLDFDNSDSVDKDEFRTLLSSLLQAKYHLSGLHDPAEPDEFFSGLGPADFHAVAKFKANRMVRDIFLFADQNRDGELSMKEFLHWCRRGGREVELLHNVLAETLGN